MRLQCVRFATKDLHVMQHYGTIVVFIQEKNRTSTYKTMHSLVKQFFIDSISHIVESF